MSVVWKVVRVVKWAALAVFTVSVAAVPWGWTAAAAIVVTVIGAQLYLRTRSTGRHVQASGKHGRRRVPERRLT